MAARRAQMEVATETSDKHLQTEGFPHHAHIRRAAFHSATGNIELSGELHQVEASRLSSTIATQMIINQRSHHALFARPFGSEVPALIVLGTSRLESNSPENSTTPAGGQHLQPPSAGLDDPELSATEVPSRYEFEQRVSAAVSEESTGELNKVVLGRRFRLTPKRNIESGPTAEALFARLITMTSTGYGFQIPLPRGGEFVGRSPELLIRLNGNLVESYPLAGSLPESGDAETDRNRRQELCKSVKDLTEHQFVVDNIVGILSKICDSIEAPPSPKIFSTGTMLHLGTPIRARLRAHPDGSFATITELAELLHPTPAVCGTPTDLAHDFINRFEEPRGYFTGYVGWQDRKGDGECAVAIRAAEIWPDHIDVYSGAGIVSASLPEKEADETAAKMRTILRALSVEEPPV